MANPLATHPLGIVWGKGNGDRIPLYCVSLWSHVRDTTDTAHLFKAFPHFKAFSVVPFSCPTFLLLRIPKHEMQGEKKQRTIGGSRTRTLEREAITQSRNERPNDKRGLEPSAAQQKIEYKCRGGHAVG